MEHYLHKVQYYETDKMGIVHHSNYVRWFEEARTYILDNYGMGYDEIEKLGIIIPVTKIVSEYKSMTRFGEMVVIKARAKTYTGVRLCVEYKIEDLKTGELRCVGESEHCFIADDRLVSLKKAFPQVHEALEKMQKELDDAEF